MQIAYTSAKLHTLRYFLMKRKKSRAILSKLLTPFSTNRGQESAGMITGRLECASFKKHIGMGMVSQIFTEEILGKMRGDLGIGHTRYSTAGSSALVNCQPFEVETLQGKIAVAHNGELINCKSLRQKVRINQGTVSFSTKEPYFVTLGVFFVPSVPIFF